MLSQARICLPSFRASLKVLEPRNNLHGCLTKAGLLWHKAQVFPMLPQNYFSNAKENIENIKSERQSSKNKTDSNKNDEQVEEIKENFVTYMEREINPDDIIYEFSKKTIFEAKVSQTQMKTNQRLFLGLSTIFSGLSYCTFTYLNPWITIIPGIFLLFSLFSYRSSSRFSKKLIQKIEFVDPYHIKIFPAGLEGIDILCNVQDTEIIGIHIVPSSQEKSDKKSYVLLSNFTETTKGAKFREMRLPIDPNLSSVENMDLLKCILHGEVKQVEKFRFIKEDVLRSDEEVQEEKETKDTENESKVETQK